MSIRLMSYVFDADLPPSEKLVMLVLCDFANDQGERCHPSKNTVAEKSSLSKRQVQRVMKQLADRGLLALMDNAKGGAPGKTCHYHINVAALQRGVILSPVTGDNEDERDDNTSSVGVTPCPQGVTSATQTGDVGVTRTTSKPLRTSSSGHVDSSEDQNTTTSPFSDSENEGSEAEQIIAAHCQLHHELFGLTLSPHSMAQGDVMLAEQWVGRGIDAVFCKKVFRRRLMQRKSKGKGGVVNFRYWERAIPEEWSKRPKTRQSSASSTSNKPSKPAKIQINDTALREAVELHHQVDDWHEWAAKSIDRLQGDEDWEAVCSRIEKRLGETTFRSWIKPIRLVWKSDRLIGLNVSTRFMREWIMNHYWQDICAAWKQHAPDARIVLTL